MRCLWVRSKNGYQEFTKEYDFFYLYRSMCNAMDDRQTLNTLSRLSCCEATDLPSITLCGTPRTLQRGFSGYAFFTRFINANLTSALWQRKLPPFLESPAPIVNGVIPSEVQPCFQGWLSFPPHFGNPGSGKTHLLCAIEQELTQQGKQSGLPRPPWP